MMQHSRQADQLAFSLMTLTMELHLNPVVTTSTV